MKKRAKSLFIGRFQPCSVAHMWLFEQKLNKGFPILIAIRDIEPDEKNPLSAEQVKFLWEKVYSGNEKVSVMIIPDIESVNWGRTVGYECNEHVPPADICNISATQIREHIKNGSEEWKAMVDEKIHEDIFNLLKPKKKVCKLITSIGQTQEIECDFYKLNKVEENSPTEFVSFFVDGIENKYDVLADKNYKLYVDEQLIDYCCK